MPTIEVNGVDLYYESQGEGPPLVLVHGSWVDHTNWQETAALLADSYRVITYDRRGHSRSERPDGPTRRRENEDDLAALIEALGCAPAHVAANSYGGLIALGLAARRPELLLSVTAHEPPAVSTMARSGLTAIADEVNATVREVIAGIAAGETEGPTRRFMEHVALGAGSWEMLPEAMRATCMANAPAFAAEQRDADWSSLDLAAVERAPVPVLLTKGDASLPWFALALDCLAEGLPGARTATIAGAGHAPHVSHPAEYAKLVAGFAGAWGHRAAVGVG
jgi:pimeloyl-ACP methyl ester carboxylesterase